MDRNEKSKKALNWFAEQSMPENGLATENFWEERREYINVIQALIDRDSPKEPYENHFSSYYECPICGYWLTNDKERLVKGMYCPQCGQYVQKEKEEDE